MHDPQTSGLVEALKKLLKARGVTYRQLAAGLGLSEPSVKRLFSERTFTLQRLEQVCQVLEIDFFELAKLARGASTTINEMTIEQEQILAKDSKLLGVFYLASGRNLTVPIVAHGVSNSMAAVLIYFDRYPGV